MSKEEFLSTTFAIDAFSRAEQIRYQNLKASNMPFNSFKREAAPLEVGYERSKKSLGI